MPVGDFARSCRKYRALNSAEGDDSWSAEVKIEKGLISNLTAESLTSLASFLVSPLTSLNIKVHSECAIDLELSRA